MAIVPSLVSLIIVPLLLYIIYLMMVNTILFAPKRAKEKLEKMGPIICNDHQLVLKFFEAY